MASRQYWASDSDASAKLMGNCCLRRSLTQIKRARLLESGSGLFGLPPAMAIKPCMVRPSP